MSLAIPADYNAEQNDFSETLCLVWVIHQWTVVIIIVNAIIVIIIITDVTLYITIRIGLASICHIWTVVKVILHRGGGGLPKNKCKFI